VKDSVTKPSNDQSSRRIGIRDVAARAGVGIATVSRVLSGSADVRAELRERVLTAARELDYQPDVLAQSLRRGATRSCGFIADDLANHLIADIATGAERVLRAQGYSLLVMNSELDPALDPINIRALLARRVDALMMCPVEEDDPPTVEALRSLHIPVCIVEGDQPPSVRASYVHSDHRAGVVAALHRLLELGHRNIALLTGPNRYRSARQRRLGLDDVVAEGWVGAELRHVAGELTPHDGERLAGELLGLAERPTALVVGGARLLLGVLRAIAGSGLEPGRDLSLVTSDALEIETMFRPPHASITRDAEGLGAHAATLLLQRLADPELPPETVVLPTVYQDRASVGPPPVGLTTSRV
jgi:LacI family transcriptional regulator